MINSWIINIFLFKDFRSTIGTHNKNPFWKGYRLVNMMYSIGKNHEKNKKKDGQAFIYSNISSGQIYKGYRMRVWYLM